MTIDEAIARERQLAKEQRSHVGTWDDEYSKKCKVYAEEHEQIAEWLEELKELREKNETLKALYEDVRKEGNNLLKRERNKTIDEFVQIFKSRTTMENKLVDEIAEELKSERSVTTSKAHEHIMRRFMKKE